MSRSHACALFVATLALVPVSASADSPARTHDGFYFRFGIGPGYAAGSRSFGGHSHGGGGIAVNTELAIGGTIAPGLVIGGGTFPMVSPVPTYGDHDAGGNHFSATGVFADWYFDPTGGLHAQTALLLVAGYSEGDEEVDSGAVGFGFGAMLGAGYDFWIADQWSLGALLRFTYYHWSAETDAGNDVGVDLVSSSVLAAITYH